MTTVDEFLQLKNQIDRLEQQYHKLQGSKETLLGQLTKQFGCQTVEEAVVKLEELQERISQLERQRRVKLKKFTLKWTDKLDEFNSKHPDSKAIF